MAKWDRELKRFFKAGVNISSLADNDILTYNSATTEWTNQSASEAAIPIDDLSDVVITSVADNELLAYDSGGNWINQTAAEAGLVQSIDDLSDVTISSVGDGELLQYSSGAFINRTFGEMITYADWTPELGVSGGTFTGTSITKGRYSGVGKMIHGEIIFAGTTGSTATYVTFTLPVTRGNATNVEFAAIDENGEVIASWTGSSTTIARVYATYQGAAGGTWTNGAHTMQVTFAYEAA